MVPQGRSFVAFHLKQLTFERFTTTLFFLAIVVAACFSPAQNDTWWHLRAGQDISASGTIGLRDSYSHTVAGAYWPNHEWLSQVLFFAIYRIGGLPLLTALAAGLIAGSWLWVWRLIPAGAERIRLPLCCVALISSSSAWSLRPQVFTLFLLGATAFATSRRRYAWLPPMFLVWANLHGGVVLGFAVLAGAIMASFVEERTLPLRPLAISAGCFVATTVTPLGPSLWLEVLAFLARSRPYGIAEFRVPGLFEPAFMPFWLLAAALVVLVLERKPWRWPALRESPLVWAALAMLPLAAGSGRNVPPFLIVAVPAIAALFASRRPSTLRLPEGVARPRLHAGLLAAFAVVGFTSVTYAWETGIPRLAWHPLPQAAIDAVTSCPGPLYNRFDDGGYLIWFLPERKVFLDSRELPYPSALVHDQIRVETSGDYEQLFDRYRISCAFIGSGTPVANRLKDAGWIESYHGGHWAVFRRSDEQR